MIRALRPHETRWIRRRVIAQMAEELMGGSI